MAEICAKKCCAGKKILKETVSLNFTGVCLPFLPQLTASAGPTASVKTSAREETLGVAPAYAWAVMGPQSPASAQTSPSADAPATAASAPSVVSFLSLCLGVCCWDLEVGSAGDHFKVPFSCLHQNASPHL